LKPQPHAKQITFIGYSWFLAWHQLQETEATFDPPTEAKLIFKFKFDSTQVRLNNLGEPADVAPGHAAQSPKMTAMSAHYIELAPNATTPLGMGDILYRAAETTAGGDSAIDFEKAVLVQHDSVFLTVPIKAIKPGDYEWLRVSISYQAADVSFLVDTTVGPITVKKNLPGQSPDLLDTIPTSKNLP